MYLKIVGIYKNACQLQESSPWQFNQPEKIVTKNVLIYEKNFKGLVICFTRYYNCKSIKMLSLYFYKLMGKIEEHEGTCLIVDYDM